MRPMRRRPRVDVPPQMPAARIVECEAKQSSGTGDRSPSPRPIRTFGIGCRSAGRPLRSTLHVGELLRDLAILNPNHINATYMPSTRLLRVEDIAHEHCAAVTTDDHFLNLDYCKRRVAKDSFPQSP